jgi:hypothetical protein
MLKVAAKLIRQRVVLGPQMKRIYGKVSFAGFGRMVWPIVVRDANNR